MIAADDAEAVPHNAVLMNYKFLFTTPRRAWELPMRTCESSAAIMRPAEPTRGKLLSYVTKQEGELHEMLCVSHDQETARMRLHFFLSNVC